MELHAATIGREQRQGDGHVRDDFLNQRGHPGEDDANVERVGNRRQQRLQLVPPAATILFERQEPLVLRDDSGFSGITHGPTSLAHVRPPQPACPLPDSCPDLIDP